MLEGSAYKAWANEGSNLPAGFVDDCDSSNVRQSTYLKDRSVKESKEERLAKYNAEKDKIERYISSLRSELKSGKLNYLERLRNEDMISNLNHAILNIKY
jgi:hypothetical protein